MPPRHHIYAENAPRALILQAAVQLSERWLRARPKAAGHAVLTFDYAVSLQVWIRDFELEASRQLAERKIPVKHQKLLLFDSENGDLRKAEFPRTVSVVEGKLPVTFEVDLQRDAASVAFRAVRRQASVERRLPGRTPLQILERPVVLLRILELLLAIPVDADNMYDSTSLIWDHLTTHGAVFEDDEIEPHSLPAPVPLAVLLLDLRALFEAQRERSRRLSEPALASSADLLRHDGDLHRGVFLSCDAWEELAERVRVLQDPEWVHGMALKRSKLELFLRDHNVATAHADLELEWPLARPLAFTRHLGGADLDGRERNAYQQSYQLRGEQPKALAQRNRSAWGEAFVWFDVFLEIVARGEPPGAASQPAAHSLAKRAVAPRLTFEPQARRQL